MLDLLRNKTSIRQLPSGVNLAGSAFSRVTPGNEDRSQTIDRQAFGLRTSSRELLIFSRVAKSLRRLAVTRDLLILEP